MGIKSSIHKNDNPKARMNPAYFVYQELTMTSVAYKSIMSNWVRRGVDKYGFDLRYATCEWVADNLEYIAKSLIPESHPRTFVVTNNSVLTIVAIAIGAVSVLTAFCTLVGIVYKYKKGILCKAAQFEFLFLLGSGLVLVAIGGLLLGVEPSAGTCTTSVWMINVGYTLQLVPTMIKISAILKIIQQSKKMRVVKVSKKKLLVRSVVLSAVAALYSGLWTFFDMPQSYSSLEVTEKQNEYGETVVSVSNYCESESNYWAYVSFAIQAFLLSSASVLAYQMRKAPNVSSFNINIPLHFSTPFVLLDNDIPSTPLASFQSIDDTRPLSLMIYTSFSFLALRLTVYVVSQILSDESSALIAPLQKARSIFVSLDAMVDVIIFFKHYFVAPKPKKQSVLRGARLYESNIAQRQSSIGDPEDSVSLGGSPFIHDRHRLDNEISENVETESQNEINKISSSIIGKVKAPFHRLGSIDSDTENMPRHSSFDSVDEEHNGKDLHPRSSIMAKVKAPFHRFGSMDSDTDNEPHVAREVQSTLGSIQEENNGRDLGTSIAAKIKAPFHRKGSMESDADNSPRVLRQMPSSLDPVVEEKHTDEDLHPVRMLVLNGNEAFDLPKWVVKEYATNVTTECTSLLNPVVEEA